MLRDVLMIVGEMCKGNQLRLRLHQHSNSRCQSRVVSSLHRTISNCTAERKVFAKRRGQWMMGGGFLCGGFCLLDGHTEML